MPEPFKRVRNEKRVKKKSSGGHTVTQFRAKKANVPVCSECGEKLAGLPTQEISKINKLSQTQRKISRIHGGNLCSICLQNLLRQTTRNL